MAFRQETAFLSEMAFRPETVFLPEMAVMAVLQKLLLVQKYFCQT